MPLFTQGFQEFMANPPKREDSYTSFKAARDEEDAKIIAMLDAEIAKDEAKKKAEEEAIKRQEIEVIAQQWAIKEYSLRSIGGDIGPSVTEMDFIKSVWDEALVAAENTYDYINSDEYKKKQERTAKDSQGYENKLFWNGMDPLLRKKREKMVEKVKKQYMDLLSEEELEAIILSE
jgi:phosphopantetheinyl transferase (holo-ACP synthase)